MRPRMTFHCDSKSSSSGFGRNLRPAVAQARDMSGFLPNWICRICSRMQLWQILWVWLQYEWSLYLYIYIYTHAYTHTHVYIYIHIYRCAMIFPMVHSFHSCAAKPAIFGIPPCFPFPQELLDLKRAALESDAEEAPQWPERNWLPAAARVKRDGSAPVAGGKSCYKHLQAISCYIMLYLHNSTYVQLCVGLYGI